MEFSHWKEAMHRTVNVYKLLIIDEIGYLPLGREQANAFHMVQRRAKTTGLATQIGCHTFRATGITIYLSNGGVLEKAQMMAAHESPRTTKLYDRTSDAVSLDEVERVVF